jgi:hypothetical protein
VVTTMQALSGMGCMAALEAEKFLVTQEDAVSARAAE